MLGHKSLAMAIRYARRDASTLREAVDEQADRMAALMDGEDAGKVIPVGHGFHNN